MGWFFDGKPYDTISDSKLEGFVYLITNKINNRKYIGKKSFWTRRANKKTKRKKTLESNWRDYYGSCNELKTDIIVYGVENFQREILHLCKYKKCMSFFEEEEQWKRKVLHSFEYYNTSIGGKYFFAEAEKIYGITIS